MSPKPITNIDDPRYVRALAHPIRVRILAVLEEREASPVELSKLIDVNLGLVSYHVRRLNQLGLLKLVRKAQRRGAVEHYYRARERPRVSDEAWAKAPAVAKQALMGATLEQMFTYVQRSAAAGGFDRAEAHATRTALKLDEKGWRDLTRAAGQFLERVSKLENAAEARRQKADHDDGFRDVGLAVLAFDALPFSEPADASEAHRTGSSRTPRRRRGAGTAA